MFFLLFAVVGFQSSIGAMVEASRARNNVAQALFELRSECGLPITANVKQCLRVLLQRLANCPEVVSCQLSSDNVVSFIIIQLTAYIFRSMNLASIG